MSTDDGAVLYVKPWEKATTQPPEFNEALSQFSTGLTLAAADSFAKTDAGEYEIRAFGSAQIEGVKMVARYYFWEITRRMSWEEWEQSRA